MNNDFPFNLNSIFNIFSNCNWANDQFCVFETLKNEFYLIFKIDLKIKCVNLEQMSLINDFNIIAKKSITCIRHYNKIIKNKDLILICFLNEIKIFDFYDDFKNIISIDNKKNVIYLLYNSAILLNNLNKNYIIVSNFNGKNLELFDFNGKLIKNLCFDKKGIHFIDVFYDNQMNKNFIVTNKGFNNKFEICSFIFENENETFYNCFKFNKYMKNFQLKRIKNIVFLFTSNKNEIFQYDFHEGILIKKIVLNDNNIKLNMILIWNENYIFSSSQNKQIFLFDINKGILIKEYKKHESSVFGLKKIKIKNKTYLISQGYDRIIIWK